MNRYFLLLSLLYLSACSLDYSGAGLVESLDEEIPNTIIFTYESVEIQDGSPVTKIEAEKAEVYDSKEETYLTNVHFYNFEDDQINNHGKSDYAVLEMKTGDARLTGSIRIDSTEDSSSLSAESLYWTDEDKTLTSDPKDSVLVIDKEGSTLEGRGFSAEIRRKTILFSGGIKGEFRSDED